MFTLGLKKIIYWLTLLNVGLISTQSVATGPRVAPSLFSDNTEYIYGMDFPPYISHDEIENGVIADIVNAVLKKENISADIMILPSKNMVKYYFSEENVLAVIGYNFDFNKANKTKADFIPILSVDEFYIYNSQRFPEGLHWEGNLNIFSGMHYGTYKGNNVSAYKEAGIIVKYGRLKSLLTQLELQKLDFMRVTAETINRFNENNTMVRLEPSIGTILLGVVFNNQHPKGIESAKKFKAGLQKIKANGVFEALVKKHLGHE